MKFFGNQMIQEKLSQCYPENPFIPKQAEEYVRFEKQLAEVVIHRIEFDRLTPSDRL